MSQGFPVLRGKFSFVLQGLLSSLLIKETLVWSNLQWLRVLSLQKSLFGSLERMRERPCRVCIASKVW